MERGRIIRAKKKPPGGLLEARTAIRFKHLASRRPQLLNSAKLAKREAREVTPVCGQAFNAPGVERMSFIAALMI